MEKQVSFREIRYREKRRKILDCAARVFARKGYEKASLEEIAAKLKLSKTSLYHYIKSKEEVLFLIQLEAAEEAMVSLQQVLDSDLDPAEKLKTAVKNHVRIITQKHVIGALKQQELILSNKWKNRIVTARDQLEKTFQKIIEEGLESGLFTALDWKMSTLAALGAMNWIITWYNQQGRLSVDEIGEAAADFILRGFSCHPHKFKEDKI